jgi:predicted nuclease of predicted toxin-antitoxin system
VKLLLDQNISYRLVDKINLIFPGTEQVKRLGLENETSSESHLFLPAAGRD